MAKDTYHKRCHEQLHSLLALHQTCKGHGTDVGQVNETAEVQIVPSMKTSAYFASQTEVAKTFPFSTHQHKRGHAEPLSMKSEGD